MIKESEFLNFKKKSGNYLYLKKNSFFFSNLSPLRGRQTAHKNEYQVALTSVAQTHDLLVTPSPGSQGQ